MRCSLSVIYHLAPATRVIPAPRVTLKWVYSSVFRSNKVNEVKILVRRRIRGDSDNAVPRRHTCEQEGGEADSKECRRDWQIVEEKERP